MRRRPFIERDTGWGDFLNMLLLRRVYRTPARVAEQADAPASSTGVRQGRESSSLYPGTTIDDYRNAPSGVGPLADEWADKPHRLIYDLCGEIETLRESILFLCRRVVDEGYVDHAVQQADDHQGERWLNPPHPVKEGEPE